MPVWQQVSPTPAQSSHPNVIGCSSDILFDMFEETGSEVNLSVEIGTEVILSETGAASRRDMRRDGQGGVTHC